MQFTTERDDVGTVIVRAAGRLNMVSAPQLRQLVERSIATGASRFAIDLSETDFMDSSGLGALIGCMRTARAAGGDLRIASPTAQVSLVLRLTNTEEILGTSDDALTAFADSPALDGSV